MVLGPLTDTFVTGLSGITGSFRGVSQTKNLLILHDIVSNNGERRKTRMYDNSVNLLILADDGAPSFTCNDRHYIVSVSPKFINSPLTTQLMGMGCSQQFRSTILTWFLSVDTTLFNPSDHGCIQVTQEVTIDMT